MDNTAETVATGSISSPEAGKVATVVKTVRNALIGFVVLGFATWWATKDEREATLSGTSARIRFLWQKFPRFVPGFVVVAAISLGLVLLTSRVLGWYR